MNKLSVTKWLGLDRFWDALLKWCEYRAAIMRSMFSDWFRLAMEGTTDASGRKNVRLEVDRMEERFVPNMLVNPGASAILDIALLTSPIEPPPAFVSQTGSSPAPPKPIANSFSTSESTGMLSLLPNQPSEVTAGSNGGGSQAGDSGTSTGPLVGNNDALTSIEALPQASVPPTSPGKAGGGTLSSPTTLSGNQSAEPAGSEAAFPGPAIGGQGQPSAMTGSGAAVSSEIKGPNIWFSPVSAKPSPLPHNGGGPNGAGPLYAGNWNEWSSGVTWPFSDTLGPDQRVWYTDSHAVDSVVGAITTAGTVSTYGFTGSYVTWDITPGPPCDPNTLWFTAFSSVTGNTDFVGRMSTGGALLTRVYIPAGGFGLHGITTGPDGNLWVCDWTQNEIIRITPPCPTITKTIYPLPTGSANPEDITPGPVNPDHSQDLWFTIQGSGQIGKITTGGAITVYGPAGGNGGPNGPFGIVNGPDNALWFTMDDVFTSGASKIGRITTAGVVTYFPLSSVTHGPRGIEADPNGANLLWFADANNNSLDSITTSGTVTYYPTPTTKSGPSDVTGGADNNLWLTETSAGPPGNIARFS
jgi:virginiamycin B lyase